MVLSEEPAELKNSLSSLQSNNAVLKTQVTQLQEELKEKEQYLEAARLDAEKIKEEAQAEIKRLRKLTAQIADLSFENQNLKYRLYEIQKCAKNAQKILRDCKLLSVN